MSKKLLMNDYSENGLMPVTDGLICWFDGRDGSGTDTIWKDRSGNSNDGILKDYNFNKDKWTGNSFYMDYTPYSSILVPSLSDYDIGTVEIYCNLIGTSGWNVVMGTELIFVNPLTHGSIVSTKYGWYETHGKFVELNKIVT